MAVDYITTPLKTLGASTVRWVAIHNDVLFKVRRKDFAVTGSTNSSGQTSLTIGAGTVPFLTVGGRVWVSLLSGVEGYYTIISNTSGAIVINLPWTASTTGVVNVSTDFTDYLLHVTYQYWNGSAWVDYRTSEHQMGPDFTATVNISPFVKALVNAVSQSVPAGTNVVATGLDMLINIQFEESYGSADGDVYQNAHSDEQLRIVDAALQLQDSNNTSMKLYLTNAVPDQTLKFMSAFEQPTFWKGTPFGLYFIYSELMTNADIRSTEQEFIGTTGGTSVTTAMDESKIGHVNMYMLQDGYADSTESIKVKIKIHSGADLSENITVRYKNCLPRNPVCLKFYHKGSWNFWVFGIKQVEGLNVTAQQGEFSRFIEDLSTADTDSDFITKECTPEITMGADMLDLNDITGLKKILYSKKVMICMNLSSFVRGSVADVWQTVKLVPSRFKVRDTKGAFNSLEFTIQLPELFIETN